MPIRSASRPARSSSRDRDCRWTERDSTNHACSSLVWLTTRSMISRMCALLDAREHAIEVGHGAEFVHYLAIVADVVAIVGIGRIVVGREPDDVDAELLKVVEMLA